MNRRLFARSACLPLSFLAACAQPDGFEAEGVPHIEFDDNEDYEPSQVLVRYTDGTAAEDQADIEAALGLEIVEDVTNTGAVRLLVPEGIKVREAVEALRADARVEFAEPNYRGHSMGTVNDPYTSLQWNLDLIGAGTAWDTTTGSGVIVAILDTGLSTAGDDTPVTLVAGYDFIDNDGDPTDKNGHGSHVAGTVAQATNNAVGVAGVAPGVSIMPVRVLDASGSGTASSIANGITWAVDHGARVLNLSLGTYSSSSTLKNAVNYARGKGAILVAAAGNEYGSTLNYPARYEGVIAVGAVRFDRSRSGYSNTGSGIDFMAPGGDTAVDQNGDGYADGILQETFEGSAWSYYFWDGTSMATPHVAAAAALVYSRGYTTYDAVYNQLKATSTDLGSAGYDSAYGYGLINVAAAVGSSGSAPAPVDSDLDGYTSGSDCNDANGAVHPGAAESCSDSIDNDCDGATNENCSAADTTAPTLSSISGSASGTSMTISWVTNEAATTWVNFECCGAYGDDNLTTNHVMTFTVSTGYTYYFTLTSKDAAGNSSTSGRYYFSL